MPFTEEEKTDIRRFCGYGVKGKVPEYPFGVRFFTFFGDLEYKLDRLLPDEEVIVRKYLVILIKLEDDLPLVADNLDTDRAAVWYHNKNELSDRNKLFTLYRKKLSSFLAIPFQGNSGMQIKMIV
jgi:hypothetical protein